ncbi:hypothetical protein [Leifsonia sp. 71-9]|uniref:hypothetical protein n=1 Tax=Leifsonia sp. 71-9 TaxID=1895934 RepID=UPI0009277641|nr:hypothetical protein [Leifsonia sp. 71-9]OJX72844.1 MAG: hypothetical protein BGO91_13830 [Leifsonia sp. 71-9]
MATRYVQSFESGGAVGSPVTTINPSGDKPFSANPQGTVVVDNTHVAHGSKSGKFSPTAGATCSARWTGLNVPVGSTFGVSGYGWYDAISASETYIWRLNDTAGALMCMIEMSNTGKFRLIDKNGTTTPLFNSGLNLPTGQEIRYEVFGTIGASAPLKCALFAGDSLTPLAGYSTSVSNANLGTTAGDVSLFGKGDTGSYATPFWQDSLQFEVGGADFIGPWVSQLATPALSLENSINPTTAGGSDGQATVSWAAVPGAGSYNAYKSTLASPTDAQLAAGLVQAGVTSPFTFTGLKAGGTTVAIQAEP